MPDQDDVRLVAVPADLAARPLDGQWLSQLDRGLTAGRGWPHEDTAPGLGFGANGGRSWLVVTPDGVVGEAGTKAPPDGAGAVEIGYGLSPSYRGRGIGTVAVRRLLTALATDADIRIVEAEVDPRNLPSQRLLERLGFSCILVAATQLRYRLQLQPPEHMA